MTVPTTTPPTTPTAGNPPATPPAGANPPATPSVDVDTQIAKAIAQRDAAHAAKFKEATGFDNLEAMLEDKLKKEGDFKSLAESKTAEAAKYKSQLQKTTIQNTLLFASSEALKPDQIVKMLSGDCVVDDNGVVTINGKPAKDAVTEFLKDNPNLAKPSGNQGSGTPHNAGSASVEVSKMTPAQKMAAGRKTGAK